MGNIVSGVSQKFIDARTAFTNSINNIKSEISGAVTWFFDSGKRVVETFANGISSAFTGAVDTVKSGLQRIRNMLPFSDAKEGPLSSLTLSGQRTMTTYAHGLSLAQDAPADAMGKSLDRASAVLDREPAKKISFGSSSSEDEDSSTDNSATSGKSIVIQKLIIPVELKRIKELPQLLALVRELEEYMNGNDIEDADDDADGAYSYA